MIGEPHRESLGHVTIKSRAIAEIVGLTAMKIANVKSLKGNFLENVLNASAKAFLNRPFPYHGIRVLLSDRDVAIRVSVVAAYGADLGETAAAIQDKVRDTVEAMSGLAVSEVSVTIVSVE